MFIKRYTLGFYLICIGVTLLSVTLSAKTLYQRNYQLRKDNQQLTTELKTLQANYRITEEAYRALSETQLQIDQKSKSSVQQIKASPKRHNAPLAPVLKQALEVLP